MHSSSETQFFKNLTPDEGKRNEKKSRIEVAILMTSLRENSFLMEKNKKPMGGFQFF